MATMNRRRRRYPRTALPSPAPAPTARPNAKQPFQLDLAERIFIGRDPRWRHPDVEFLDGASLRGRPSAFGLYSIRLQTDDGSEAIVFKHGLRALRRCA